MGGVSVVEAAKDILPADSRHVGCYTFLKEGGSLDWQANNLMSEDEKAVEECIQICFTFKYAYAAKHVRTNSLGEG